MPYPNNSGPFLAMRGPFPAAAGGSISLTSGTPTISVTDITVPATSSGSLVGYAYGIELGIGISAGYTDAVSVAGAAVDQEITVDIADFGGTTASVVNVRPYYNADPLDLDPADRVYGSAVPVVVNSASETGTETEGETLTGAHGVIVGPSGMTLSQAWQRCDSGGANCEAIAGETATTYVLAAADVGNTIKFQQTATNGADSDTATSAASGVIASAASPMALVQAWTVTDGVGTRVTGLGSAPTEGSVVIAVGASNDASATAGTPTDNFGDTGGTAWALKAETTPATPSTHFYIWTRVIGAGATGTDVSMTTSGFTWSLHVGEYSNPDQTNVIDGSVTSGAGSSSVPQPSAAITTTLDSDVVIGVFVKTGAVDLTAGSGYTLSSQGTVSGRNSQVITKITTAAGDYTPLLSASTANNWACIAMAVKGQL